VSLEISPEPTPEEREALLCAFAAIAVPAAGSAWWEAGIRESVEDDPDALQGG
jgi:hypothetical protein